MNDGDGIILWIVRHLHTHRPSIQVEDVINVRQNFYNAVAMQHITPNILVLKKSITDINIRIRSRAVASYIRMHLMKKLLLSAREALSCVAAPTETYNDK